MTRRLTITFFIAPLTFFAATLSPAPDTGVFVSARSNDNMISGSAQTSLCATANPGGAALTTTCSAVPLLTLPDSGITSVVLSPSAAETQGVGRADGSTGTVAGRAWSVGQADGHASVQRARGTARLVDGVIFQNSNVTVTPSVTALFGIDGTSDPTTYLQTNLVYNFALIPFPLEYYLENGFTAEQYLAAYLALSGATWRLSAGRYRDGGVNGAFYYFGQDNEPYGGVGSLPGVTNPRVWSEKFILNVPTEIPLMLISELIVSSNCRTPSDGGACLAIMESLGSGKVGILGDYTSMNGFSYPGLPAGPVDAVPEPESWVLIATGGAALALKRIATRVTEY